MVKRILWAAAKADANLLERSSEMARMTQTGFGAMLLLAWIFAACSFGYAVSVSFESTALAVVAGAVWATSIFLFDREILASRRSWVSGLARLLLAGAIGFTVAVPLELRFFEGRIEEELERLADLENPEFAAEVERIRSESAAAKAEFDRDLSGARTQLATLTAQQGQLAEEVAALEAKRSSAYSLMQGEAYGISGSGLSGFVGRGRRHDYHKSLVEDSERLIARSRRRLATIELAVQEASSDVASKAARRPVFEGEVDAAQADRVLAAREALYVEQSFDLLSRFETLEAIKEESLPAWWLGWAIRVLLVLFEVAGIVAKLFSESDDYVHAVLAQRACAIQAINVAANSRMAALEQDPAREPEDPAEEPFAAPRFWWQHVEPDRADGFDGANAGPNGSSPYMPGSDESDPPAAL